MRYASDALKKEYRKKCNTQRTINLKKLREDIAQLSLTDFAKNTGITKNDICMLEKGDKQLSLFHILAYKKFFLNEHKISLSVDFIMGFTDIMENTNLNYQTETGLSYDALETLKMLKRNNNITNALSILNLLMSDSDHFTALLCNIDAMLNSEAYQTCGIAQLSNGDKAEIKDVLKSDECFAFIKKDIDGSPIGTLKIDSTILASHAYQKLKDVILEYKGK